MRRNRARRRISTSYRILTHTNPDTQLNGARIEDIRNTLIKMYAFRRY